MTEERIPRRRGPVVAGLVVAAILAMMLAVVGVTAVALPGCSACHMNAGVFADATSATTHAGSNVRCVDCHVTTSSVTDRTTFAIYEILGMWLPLLDTASTDVSLVADVRCLACHEQVYDEIVDARGIRITHATCAEGSMCTDCHSETGHGEATAWPRTPAMNACVQCHRTSRASLECTTCHSGKVERTGSVDPEFEVTHGPQWQQTHGMGQMSSCSLCHEETDCARCHGPGVPHADEFLGVHAEISQQDGATCTTCHEQAFCDSCHLTPMPHTGEFVTGHSAIVADEGEAGCLRCHALSDCDTCHTKHVHPGGAVGNIPSPDRGDR